MAFHFSNPFCFHKFITVAVLSLFSASAFAATSIPLTINMSEAVNVTGTPQVAVDVGGVTRYATYTSGTGTSALTFTYTMTAGDVDLDGVTLTSPIDLNGGTMKDGAGNDTTLTFSIPNTSNVKVNYPSLGMDFVYDADGRYTLNGTAYNDLPSFLTATGGSFTRASIGTYYDSSGVLQTATSNTPRFDYDPVTHTPKGILIEEARTNSLTRSSEFDNAIWTKYATSIVANTTAASDGSITADKISMSDTNNYHFIYYNISKPSSTSLPYTFSVYVKQAEFRYLLIALTDAGWGNNGTATADIQSGAISPVTYHGTGFTSGTSTITNIGNGWFKISLSITSDASSSITGIIQLENSLVSNFAPSTGSVGDGIYIWGAQLEQGSFPTSYIPTTTASVTRSADELSFPVGSILNTIANSLFTDIDFGTSSPQGRGIVGAGPYASPYGFGIMQNGGTNDLAFHSTTESYPDIALVAGGFSQGSNKIAVGYDMSISSANIIRNGAIVGSSSTTAFASHNWASKDIGIGRNRGTAGGTYLNGTVKKIKIYPTRVPNTQLQLMTQ